MIAQRNSQLNAQRNSGTSAKAVHIPAAGSGPQALDLDADDCFEERMSTADPCHR